MDFPYMDSINKTTACYQTQIRVQTLGKSAAGLKATNAIQFL